MQTIERKPAGRKPNKSKGLPTREQISARMDPDVYRLYWHYKNLVPRITDTEIVNSALRGYLKEQ